MLFKNFIWFYLVLATSCVTGKKIENGTTNITYATFTTFPNKILKGVKISTEPAETLPECVQKCEDHKNCQSANFKTKQCDLLSDNKHVSKEKFETLSGSIHLAKMNRGCDEEKCVNNATCVPDYENNTHSCNCTTEYTGKFCEVFLFQSPTPDWWFKFDGGTENGGLNPNDAILTPLNEGANKVIFTGQPHRKGRYMECHSACTISTITWPGWSDGQHDFSFALWVQFHPKHPVHEETNKNSIYILETTGRGVRALYQKSHEQWVFELRLADGGFQHLIKSSPEERKKWYFIAMSLKNGIFTVFVNDVERSSSRKGSGTFRHDPPKQLFHHFGNKIINVDDLRVWYHGKSPAFLRDLYNKEKIDIWD